MSSVLLVRPQDATNEVTRLEWRVAQMQKILEEAGHKSFCLKYTENDSIVARIMLYDHIIFFGYVPMLDVAMDLAVRFPGQRLYIVTGRYNRPPELPENLHLWTVADSPNQVLLSRRFRELITELESSAAVA